MKKKLQLKELEINSFVTTAENVKIQGGGNLPTNPCITPIILSFDVDCPGITRVYRTCIN